MLGGIPDCSRLRQAPSSADDRRKLLVLKKEFLVCARVGIPEGEGGNAVPRVCLIAEREAPALANGLKHARDVMFAGKVVVVCGYGDV